MKMRDKRQSRKVQAFGLSKINRNERKRKGLIGRILQAIKPK